MGTPRRIDTTTPLGRFRAEKKMTQAELADKLCISQNTLSGLERGERPISRPVMKLFQIVASEEGWSPAVVE